jgi:hypothetical protein
LWGTFWFLLLWDRAPGRVTGLCCALLTAVSVTMAFGGLALSALGAEPEPPANSSVGTAPTPTQAAVASPTARACEQRSPRAPTVAVGETGRRVRLDRMQATAARVCRPHCRFR